MTVLAENIFSALRTTSVDDTQNRLDALVTAISGMMVLPENIKYRLKIVGDSKGTTSRRIREFPNDVRGVAQVAAKMQDMKFSNVLKEAILKDVERLEQKYVARMEARENRLATVKATEIHDRKIMRARIRITNLVERPWLKDRNLVERPWLKDRKYMLFL